MPHHRDGSQDVGEAWKIGKTEPDSKGSSLSSSGKSLGEQIVDRLIELTNADKIKWEFHKKLGGGAFYVAQQSKLGSSGPTNFWIGPPRFDFPIILKIGDSDEVRVYNQRVKMLFEVVLAKDGVKGPDSVQCDHMNREELEEFLSGVLANLS